MGARTNQSSAAISRRAVLNTAGIAVAGLNARPAGGAVSAKTGPEVYTRIGVQPFINCTATYTINGGSATLPQVIEAIEQASHYHVNLNELMEKTGDRLAQLLQVEWAFVTSGAAGALTLATAGCIAGSDPEKMRRLPNLEGLKNEVIIPRESRNVYDHAIRTVGVKIIEVNGTAELEAAIGPRTAMIEILGNHFGSAKLDLKEVAPIARKARVPILVDAAADYLIVPNPYLSLGADLVAYSGGKIIRGPQSAGLLVGRRDLVRAAWANSAPHDAFGRGLKVSKEEIVGMLRAVEVWCTERDVQADFREWNMWYRHISEQITRVPGVSAEVRGPARGGPFPTLSVSWDPEKIGLSAGEIGRRLLEGKPHIMSHAEGEGHSFVIRPVALKPGEYKIVAQRLYEIFQAAPKSSPTNPGPASPALDISGIWDVEIQYETGGARHQLVLHTNGNQLTGSHQGWAYHGNVSGVIDGSRVELRSSLPAEGTPLPYTFRGDASGDKISGTVDLGEYGHARWQAQRRS